MAQSMGAGPEWLVVKQTRFDMGRKKPDIEGNKPARRIKFWQQPGMTLILYLLFFAFGEREK